MLAFVGVPEAQKPQLVDYSGDVVLLSKITTVVVAGEFQNIKSSAENIINKMNNF